MISSFNSYGIKTKKIGAKHVPVWLGMVTPVTYGGTLDAAYALPNVLIPAGCPVNITNKVIKPLVCFVVVKVVTGGTNDTITVRPYVQGVMPKCVQVVGSTFAATGKAAAVVSATVNAEDAELVDIEVATGTLDAVSAGKLLAESASQTAGSGKALAVAPNAYLYNDIWTGFLEAGESVKDLAATGAAVKVHAEGILIDRTPAAEVAAAMATAVPGVIQVNG